MAKKETKSDGKGLNIIAITNDIRVESLSFGRIVDNQIVKYGIDNLYPQKVDNIVRDSPTANGCVKRKSEFLFGLGIEGGDVVVNRHGQTMNEIYKFITTPYSKNNGYVLHFNVNLLGEIVEIQNVDIRFVRKMSNLKTARLSKTTNTNVYDDKAFEIALWGIGEKQKNGFLYYFNASGGIYPICPMEASLTSAQSENENQVFSYMFAKNGFSGSGILKLPNVPDDETQKEAYEKLIRKVTDTRSAGSLLVVEPIKTIENDISNSDMFESFMPANVDDLYVNQNLQARQNILTSYTMPEILLAKAGSDGIFNMDSYRDAFNYYNNDSTRDRLLLQESLNKFWGDTVFTSEVSEIKVIPLDDLTKEPTEEKPTEETGEDE